MLAQMLFLLKSSLSLKTEVQNMGIAKRPKKTNWGLQPTLHAINRDPKKAQAGDTPLSLPTFCVSMDFSQHHMPARVNI